MRPVIVAPLLGLVLTLSVDAWGYGTIRKNGIIDQDLEHERITRRALSCDTYVPISNCIGEKTLDKLAGKHRLFFGTFGGVGYPDKPVGTSVQDTNILSDYALLAEEERPKTGQSLPSLSIAHCDGGDFVQTKPGYPRTANQAKAMIEGCRLWMNDHFVAAVNTAAAMAENGKLIASETKLKSNCITWSQKKNSAKCKVLTHFGIMLHASQDFYSHSNWNDIPLKGDITSDNPPGLSQSGSATWLNMPIGQEPFPKGLITGCWDGWPEGTHCEDPNASGVKIRRSKHKDINKDHGVIDVDAGQTNAKSFSDVGPIGQGMTKRGSINENFQRSVQAAILDTRLKLKNFKTALEAEYGTKNAELIFCALIKDDPIQECTN